MTTHTYENDGERSFNGKTPCPQPLFVYGTLLNADVVRRLIGREAAYAPDGLAGWRLTSVVQDGRRYPNVAPAPGHTVPGACIAVSHAELARLDAYEGTEYRRVQVLLQSGGLAWVYFVPEPLAGRPAASP